MLLLAGERIQDKIDSWEVGQGPVQRGVEQFSLKTTKTALRWIKLGMRILCLSLRISSFFLRIGKKEIHDTVFGTRAVVLSTLTRASLGQLCSIAFGLLFGVSSRTPASPRKLVPV